MPAFNSGTRDIAVAGTGLSLVSENIIVKSITIKARHTNAGNVFLGDSSVDNTYAPLRPNEILTISRDEMFDISLIYVDAANNGDDVDFWYVDEKTL